MKKYFITLICFLNFLTTSNAIEFNRVILPDFQIVGRDLKDYIPFSDKNFNVNFMKYPTQLVIDIHNGNIAGMRIYYDKSVSFEEVEDSINKIYGDWQLSKNEKPPLSLWRVVPQEMAIQLSVDDNGLVQIIVLPFRSHR